MTDKSALILGATGATGKVLLKELLSSSHFTRVGEYGRRVTPDDQLGPGKEKLQQKVIDFEKLDEAGLKDGKWDVVFITLGTTKAAAGSAAAFEKIDKDYVINAARAAKSDDAGHSQRLVYLSSSGANPNSSLLYTRSKGLTEQGLAALGYGDTVIFRPGFLKGAERTESNLGVTIFGAVTGALSHISSSLEVQIPILAKSMIFAGKLGSAALPPDTFKKMGKDSATFTVIPNSGAIALAQKES